MRIFISHSHRDRHHGEALQDFLAAHGIDTFLADKNIKVTQDWPTELRRELLSCNAFVFLLSRSFQSSRWGLQELGAAAMRSDVLMIPLLLDSTSTFGFIAHLQGGRDREVVLDVVLERHPADCLPGMVQALAGCKDPVLADRLLARIGSVLAKVPPEWPRRLVQAVVLNAEACTALDSSRARLLNLLSAHRSSLDRRSMGALRRVLGGRATKARAAPAQGPGQQGGVRANVSKYGRISPAIQQVVDALSLLGQASILELARYLGIEPPAVRQRMWRAVLLGVVQRAGRGLYRLPERVIGGPEGGSRLQGVG